MLMELLLLNNKDNIQQADLNSNQIFETIVINDIFSESLIILIASRLVWYRLEFFFLFRF